MRLRCCSRSEVNSLIVKCMSARNPVRDLRYSLTVGKSYLVLAVEFYDSAKSIFSQSTGDFCLYRIKDDEGFIVPVPSRIFVITSAEISATWVCYKQADDCYSLLPQLWAYQSFWDDFYNHEPMAREAAHKVTKDLDRTM